MEKKTNTSENRETSYKIKIIKYEHKDAPGVSKSIKISSLDTLNGYLEDTNKNGCIDIFCKEDAKDIWKTFIGLCEDKTRYEEYAKKILQFDRNKEKNSLQALEEMAEEVGITNINIDVKNPENVAEALTKISIAQEQKKQNKINSSKLLEINKVSTVDLKTDFTINTTTIGADNTDISVSSKDNFMEIFRDSYTDKGIYFSNDPKNIREICNMIIHYQATLGKDSDEYKEFMKNFVNELNDKKYETVGCNNIKKQFIDEFQRIGKSEGIEINFQDFGYNGIQYNSYFEGNDIDKLISRLEPLAAKISRDIKAKNRTQEERNSTLDKIEDLLLNFNDKIVKAAANRKKNTETFYNSINSKEKPSLTNEEIEIVRSFIAYVGNSTLLKSKINLENLGDIIDAKIKEIVGEEEYKIYEGELKDKDIDFSEALIESLNGVNSGNRLSYSQDLILKGYRKAIKDIIEMAKKKVNDKSVVEAFNEVLEEMAEKVKFNKLKEEFFKKNESTKSAEGFDKDTLKKFFEEKFNKQNEEINKNHENKKNLKEELEQNEKELNDTKTIIDKIDIKTVREEFRKAQNPTEEELKEKEEFLTKRIEEIKGIYTEQIDNIVESDKSDDKKKEDFKNLTSENEDIGIDNKKISKKYRYALAANMKDLEKVKLKKYNCKIERANKIEELLGKLKEGTLGEDKKELKELLEKEKLNDKESARLTELDNKKTKLNKQEQKELTELERRNTLYKLSNNINKVTGDAAKTDTVEFKKNLEQQRTSLKGQKDKSIKDIVDIIICLIL